MPYRGETIQFKIPADPKYVSTIRKAVHSLACSLGFPDDVALDIEISVAEALANAVEHGSPQSGKNAIAVACKVTEDELIIDVRDEGPGFAPPTCSDPETWAEGGRGLSIIYRLMDDVRIRKNSHGSHIRMVKEKLPRSRRERTSTR